jgi:hypothetical protein
MIPPDEIAILTAFRSRLVNDATLMTLTWGVFWMDIPARVNRSGVMTEIDLAVKPALTYGTQAGIADDTYGTRGDNMVIRLMAFGKSTAPGIVDPEAVAAALGRARAVLTATPPSGAGIWAFAYESKIPATAPKDSQGISSPQAGDLYRVRAVGS